MNIHKPLLALLLFIGSSNCMARSDEQIKNYMLTHLNVLLATNVVSLLCIKMFERHKFISTIQSAKTTEILLLSTLLGCITPVAYLLYYYCKTTSKSIENNTSEFGTPSATETTDLNPEAS